MLVFEERELEKYCVRDAKDYSLDPQVQVAWPGFLVFKILQCGIVNLANQTVNEIEQLLGSKEIYRCEVKAALGIAEG
jgi:hypothetical protein